MQDMVQVLKSSWHSSMLSANFAIKVETIETLQLHDNIPGSQVGSSRTRTGSHIFQRADAFLAAFMSA